MTKATNSIPEENLRKQLDEFLTSLIPLCGDNLKSVELYGGVAKNDYSRGKSNVNILFIFERMDMEVLDALTVLFQKGISDFRLSPFILTTSEVIPSGDVFAVKLFDIQQHHILLYGTDFLSPLKFDRQHLRFISEQELRNQLSRMKFFYIQNFNLPEQILNRAQKAITGFLINANVFLFLKTGKYYASRNEILNGLLEFPGTDKSALEQLVQIKNQTTPITTELIRNGYDQLMLQCKWLIKEFK